MAKTMKVQVRNLGLVRKASLEFVPGLNVIQGPSSSGKSTVLNGIIATIFNDSGDESITKGETVSAVAIEYDGHKVIRKKDLSNKEYKTVYSVDGKGFGKIGRQPLQQALDALGFREVKITDTKVRPNFSSQFATPFLVDETPSRIFEFMTTTDDSVNLSGILHDMRSDHDVIQVEKREAEAAVNALKRTVAREREVASRYEDFAPVMDRVLKAKPMFEKLDLLEALVSKASSSKEQALKARDGVQAIDKVMGQVATAKLDSAITQVRELSPLTARAYAISKQMESVQQELEVTEAFCDRLTRVPDPFHCMDIYTRANALDRALQGMAKTKELALRIREQLDSAGRVESLTDPGEKVKNITNIATILSGMEDSIESANQVKEETQRIEGELREVQEELSKFDICPLCGQSLPHSHE